ncbi:hypothetical protein V5799_011289 [Amblyomma americanum]|uniref:Secreted protein n=1 Tax=Amblyomma americanum TaxID=6943 RepID=A0AAQ4EHQ3_AMBAM
MNAALLFLLAVTVFFALSECGLPPTNPGPWPLACPAHCRRNQWPGSLCAPGCRCQHLPSTTRPIGRMHCVKHR